MGKEFLKLNVGIADNFHLCFVAWPDKELFF